MPNNLFYTVFYSLLALQCFKTDGILVLQHELSRIFDRKKYGESSGINSSSSCPFSIIFYPSKFAAIRNYKGRLHSDPSFF